MLLALAVSALIAGFGTVALGLPFGQLWLAYAPGAVEAMAAMALALSSIRPSSARITCCASWV